MRESNGQSIEKTFAVTSDMDVQVVLRLRTVKEHDGDIFSYYGENCTKEKQLP
jgi:hypothetical protein